MTDTSAVPPFDAGHEAALLNEAARLRGPVVVVSDLHLGAGSAPDTGRYSRTENFFADEAFARFLDAESARTGGHALLVLNGDIFDFLRLTGVPDDPASLMQWHALLAHLGVERDADSLRQTVSTHERQYGLQTDDFKSVYKLSIVERGHTRFFRALAAWLQRGGWLLHVKGNHDLEMHWPLMRRALRDMLVRAGATVESAISRVCFADDLVNIANVHIEHGHRYEWMTRVSGPATLPRQPGQINLPPGSFINRYIINRLERVEPFLDNLKPVDDVLWTMAKRSPVTVILILDRGARLLARALVNLRGAHALLAAAILVAAICFLVPFVVAGALIVVITWPAARDWMIRVATPRLSAVSSIVAGLGLVLPWVLDGVRALARLFRRPRVGEDAYSAGVYARVAADRAACARWRRVYAVLGHTHVQDVQCLPPPGAGLADIVYLNTGTWIPLWSKDRPDLAGQTVLGCARFEVRDGEYRHEMLVFNDSAGSTEPAIILGPS